MQPLVSLLEHYGLVVVFLAVLVERAGVPIPTFPALVVAGAIPGAALPVLLLAIAASLPADFAWYWAGRRHGYRVLATLCRISISPDTCVQQTESLFTRWGPVSMVVSKFVPGFSVTAPPLAGAFKWPVARFLAYDALSALVWAGVAVTLGVIFHDAVEDAVQAVVRFGGMGLALVAGALGLFIAYKWVRRQIIIRNLRMDRITVDELRRLIRDGAAPLILDVRSKESQQDGMIPGALAVIEAALESLASSIQPGVEVVVYCACPNEASAVSIARRLKAMGVRRVRPLLGGIGAWTAAQPPVVPIAA